MENVNDTQLVLHLLSNLEGLLPNKTYGTIVESGFFLWTVKILKKIMLLCIQLYTDNLIAYNLFRFHYVLYIISFHCQVFFFFFVMIKYFIEDEQVLSNSKSTLCNHLGMFKVVPMSSCFGIHNCDGTECSKHFMPLIHLCILQHSVVFHLDGHFFFFVIDEVVNCETIYLVYKKINHKKFLMLLVPVAANIVKRTFCITC